MDETGPTHWNPQGWVDPVEKYKRLVREILSERGFRLIPPGEEAQRAQERADIWDILLKHQQRELEDWIEQELERRT